MATETPENVDDSNVDPGIQADADRQALIERTQARLDAVPGIEPVADAPVVEPTVEPPVEPTEEPPVEPPETPVVEPTVEVPAEEAVKTDDDKSVKPTLPEAYRRSLKSRKWTDEEIDLALETMPYDGFLKTVERIHQDRNDETARFADAGRRVLEQHQEVVVNGGVTEGKPEETPAIAPVDIEAMVAKFGNNEIVEGLAGPVNEAIKRVNQMLPQLQQSVKETEQARLDVLREQVETFFTSKELKPYVTVYGDITKAPLTTDQQENRNKVMRRADAVIAGASLQGRSLTVGEGLLMSHDSVASSYKEAAIRADLKKKTKKRARGTIVKPSHAGKPPGTGKPKTRAELEAKVQAGMGAVFGR